MNIWNQLKKDDEQKEWRGMNIIFIVYKRWWVIIFNFKN